MNQAIPLDADELQRLRDSHAELLAAVQNFVDRYPGASMLQARSALANAEALEDSARMKDGFGEALELTKKAAA